MPTLLPAVVQLAELFVHNSECPVVIGLTECPKHVKTRIK